ncbi:MAG TPA: hypothetical protein PK393_06595, partial [Synergistaceae bacterium]|nr:hypothetical protein [Synergistaceae bacterium]
DHPPIPSIDVSSAESTWPGSAGLKTRGRERAPSSRHWSIFFMVGVRMARSAHFSAGISLFFEKIFH